MVNPVLNWKRTVWVIVPMNLGINVIFIITFLAHLSKYEAFRDQKGLCVDSLKGIICHTIRVNEKCNHKYNIYSWMCKDNKPHSSFPV
jgi:hypothetical protein